MPFFNHAHALCAAALVSLGLLAGGCDEHPQPAEQDDETRPTAPEGFDEDDEAQDDGDEEAGAEGSELTRHTDEETQQCIDIVGRVMHCTSYEEFNDVLLSEEGGDWSADRLEEAAHFWSEPGAQRRTCEDVFEAAVDNDFQDDQARERVAQSVNEECEDFADILLETDMLEALGETDL